MSLESVSLRRRDTKQKNIFVRTLYVYYYYASAKRYVYRYACIKLLFEHQLSHGTDFTRHYSARTNYPVNIINACSSLQCYYYLREMLQSDQ